MLAPIKIYCNMKSTCLKCNIETNHEVIHEIEEETVIEEESWWEEYRYQLVKCNGCDTVSFRKLYNDAEREYHFSDYAGGEPTWNVETFPKRILESKDVYYLKDLPLSVDKIYSETVGSFYNDFSILCSIGLRSLIEGICKDKNISQGIVIDRKGKKRTSKNLDGKIQGLVDGGFLTSNHADTLHEIRFLGNNSVHELYEPSKDELKLAFDIVHQTLKNLYELRVLAKKLKKSRSDF